MSAPVRLIEDGFYDDYDEPPRRLWPYVLGALFLVTALLVLWKLRG